MTATLTRITEIEKVTGYSNQVARAIFKGKTVKVGGRLYVPTEVFEAFQALSDDEKAAFRPSTVEGATRLTAVAKQLGLPMSSARSAFKDAFKVGHAMYVKDEDIQAFKDGLPK